MQAMFDPNQLDETRVLLGFLLGASIVMLGVVLRWKRYRTYWVKNDSGLLLRLLFSRAYFGASFVVMFGSLIYETSIRDLSGVDVWYAALFGGVIVLIFLGMEFVLNLIKPMKN